MYCIYLIRNALGDVIWVGQTNNPKRRRSSAWSRQVAQGITSEERSRRNAKGWANYTDEQRRARCEAMSRGQKAAAHPSPWKLMTAEQRDAARAKISEKVRAAAAARKAGA